MLFFDAPYDELKNVDWEYQLNVVTLNNMFKQVNAMHTGSWQIAAIMHKPRDTDIVMTSMESSGYCQLIQFYWYKGKDHQTKTPVSSYTSSVEMGTIGFMPDRSKCKWNMGADPRHRHNHLEYKAVTKYLKYEDGTIINPCQKPPAVLRWLCQNHLHPGSTVLVIGTGSGADVIGATQACCNVVTVERDPKQYAVLQTTLVKYCSLAEEQFNEIRGEVDADDEASQGTGAGDSSPKEGDDDEGESSKCPECSNTLPYSEMNLKRVCAQCTHPAPLHINCAEEMPDGTFLCHSCYRSNVDEGHDYTDEDHGEK